MSLLRDLYWKWRFWRINRWAERNKDWIPERPSLEELLEGTEFGVPRGARGLSGGGTSALHLTEQPQPPTEGRIDGEETECD